MKNVLDVFPAPAGMNRLRLPLRESVRCVPRASGDEPVDVFRFKGFAECSPRQRG